MQLDDDTALMVKVAGGDRGAFGRLFDRHQASVQRFCRRFVGDAAVAEELAQDIFIKLYRSASAYRPSAQFKTFLFRIASNHCLNELRRPAHRHEVVEARDESAEGPGDARATSFITPEHAMEAREVEQALARALEAMTPRERAAFNLCRFEGLAYREVAEVLEATEAAVKSLMHRATLQVAQHVEALEAAQPRRSGGAHG